MIPVRVGSTGPDHQPDSDATSVSSSAFVPPVDPRSIEQPSKAVFAAMGEQAIMDMVEAFYAALAESTVASLFPPAGPELDEAARRSGAFFVGLLGGPPRYHERYGNPMMRARHLPFAIGSRERDEWLRCWDETLNRSDLVQFPTEHREGFRSFLAGFSLWMTNRR